MLVVLEGLDGAGKSTQVRNLRTYLEKICGDLEYIHFPRYEEPVYGGLIAKFLRGGFGANDAVHPQLVALLFAEDRHRSAAEIRAALKAGKTVLLDRYVYSNIAYQCAKLPSSDEAEELRDWIFNTEYVEFGIPKPDLNIFLDVPICFVESSLSSHRNGDDRNYLGGSQDIHEADISFQKRVRNIYRAQVERDAGLISVDCSDEYGFMLPADKVFDKIKAIVDKFISDNS